MLHVHVWFCAILSHDSCILGELFVKKPLFQASQEFDQLDVIRYIHITLFHVVNWILSVDYVAHPLLLIGQR